ncbi:MAG TPA: O-antigen ligase family protein [Pyrinomonadaceae bacterium]|nr:O-antigen ligase family protein [Pyrinomonadaceae bacterium]
MAHSTEPNNDDRRPITKWLDRGIVACLFVIAAFAPVSIAVTQAAWLLGTTLWVIRLAVFPRPRLSRSPIDYALLGFFILSGISGVFSYNPTMSLGKMRAASLFIIVYLIAQNIKSSRIVRLLAFTLIASCVITTLLTLGQFVVGKGVKVYGVKPASVLSQAVFHTRTVKQPTPIIDGDTIWEVDGQRINNPDELATALAGAPNAPTATVKIYRVEWTPSLEVPRGNLITGNTALEQLGITAWTRGRDWRATGFYGHWVTYAEVLQLIASFALGLFLSLPTKRSLTGIFLLLSLVLMLLSLGLTITRASWIGFAVSATLLLALSVSRRTLVAAGIVAVLLVLAGVFVLQQKRGIGLFDRSDQSTSWRETVWREGFELLVSKPRHLLVGVGIDSIKGHWREWGLFDNGRLPIGHMHSNLLQIALERGVPALIAWLILLGLYTRMLWKVIRAAVGNGGQWIARGISLGALGGLVGFFTSGIVHYNWGDSEVVTVFYFIMGLSVVVQRVYSVPSAVAETSDKL